jgi:Tfp pilus assembly major pilin PilA
MTLVIIISVIVVLALMLSYYTSDYRARAKVAHLLQTSAGGNDDNAQEALRLVSAISNKQPNDYFVRGNIVRYNLHNNEPGPHAVDEINQDYAMALAHAQVAQNPDFMIDRITEFDLQNGGLAHALAMIYEQPTIRSPPRAKVAVVRERRAQAAKISNSKRAAIDNSLNAAITYTNDPQNVHDTSVCSDLRDILRHVRCEPGPGWRESLLGALAGNQRALKVANKMLEGEVISTLGESESNILAYMWTRCTTTDTRAALANALADCIENETLTCINGRCGRVLTCLAAIDNDSTVGGGVLTYEAYKNQIMEETKRIISREIDAALASTDPAISNVGRAYAGEDIRPDQAAEAIVNEKIREAIRVNLENYRSKLGLRTDDLMTECFIYAGVE